VGISNSKKSNPCPLLLPSLLIGPSQKKLNQGLDGYKTNILQFPPFGLIV